MTLIIGKNATQICMKNYLSNNTNTSKVLIGIIKRMPITLTKLTQTIWDFFSQLTSQV